MPKKTSHSDEAGDVTLCDHAAGVDVSKGEGVSLSDPGAAGIVSKATPIRVIQELVLVRCTSLTDFLNESQSARQMMKPYWIYTKGFMEFDFINERTDQKELLQLIRKGRIYQRDPNCKMRVQEIEVYPDWSEKEKPTASQA